MKTVRPASLWLSKTVAVWFGQDVTE